MCTIKSAAGVANHSRQLAATGIDEPVRYLAWRQLSECFRYRKRQHTYLEVGLAHKVLLLILGGVGVLKVGDEPSTKLVTCFPRQVAASLAYLAIEAHDHAAYVTAADAFLIE